MHNVYVVLTRTNTIISRFIRLGTGHNYNHVSISLVEDLTELYSFGRKGKFNPFNGGFVTESFNRGILASTHTKCKVYKLYIDKEKYESLKRDISTFEMYRNFYRYNYLGAFLLRFNLSRQYKNKYFCSQFVAFVLDRHQIIRFSKNPNLYFPEDFQKHSELKLVYEGSADIYR